MSTHFNVYRSVYKISNYCCSRVTGSSVVEDFVEFSAEQRVRFEPSIAELIVSILADRFHYYLMKQKLICKDPFRNHHTICRPC